MEKGIDYIGVAAAAMIFNERGKIFLSKRGQKAQGEHGYWETPGGGVDFGETLEHAVKREIMEEYGIEIELLEQFSAIDYIIPDKHQHWVVTTFLAKIKQGHIPKIMEPEKCDEIGWFQLDSLPQPLSIVTKIDLQRYRQKL